MSGPGYPGTRLRAYLEFVTAVVYFILARSVAQRAASGLASDAWTPLVAQAMLVFLLIVGYAGFGGIFDRQQRSVSEQGLPARPGMHREIGLGLAIGWGIALVCVLPLTVLGGIAVILSPNLSNWGWLLADAAFFALATLAEEVAFRGYGFQRFEKVVGPLGATLGFSAFYAFLQGLLPGSSGTSISVSFVFCTLLTLAYLRTRALWLSWGLNFGWKASRALIFGLTVSGVSRHSSVVLGDPMGPFWATGGGFGLDGTWIAFLAFLAAIPLVYRVTRDLDFQYNAPVLEPGGIPVDVEEAARRQHEAAMGAQQPAAEPLVQIAQIAQAAPAPEAQEQEPPKPQPESGRQPASEPADSGN